MIKAIYQGVLSDWNQGLLKQLEKDINTHLWTRGFKFKNGQNIIISSKNNLFALEYELRGSIVEILVKTDSWYPEANKPLYPPIIYLILDYLRVNHHQFFYLETLTENELASIENFGREIAPFEIVELLKNEEKSDINLKPKPELIGEYLNQQIDLYSGQIKNFRGLADFWICFLRWYSNGELEYTDLNYIINRGYFDSILGECIPLKRLDISKILDHISINVEWFNQADIQKIYQMRRNFDDKVILFKLDKNYLIYNNWTIE